MNSVSEKIKNECLDGMDFERILEIYNLYIDVNQPCDFHKLSKEAYQEDFIKEINPIICESGDEFINMCKQIKGK